MIRSSALKTNLPASARGTLAIPELRVALSIVLSCAACSLFMELSMASSAEREATGQPLPLLHTHWYQDGPFARFTPQQERLGCWSTAYAQILFYHRLPPTGHVAYTCSSGLKVDLD